MIRARDLGIEIRPDAGRVVAKLFLPGESTPGSVSRTERVLKRVEGLPENVVASEVAALRPHFADRHDEWEAMMREHAATVRAPGAPPLDPDRELLVGAAFTSEYAVEGAALCNPSAVPHPNQSGLQEGQMRVLLTLRGIGESHLSSMEFVEAIVGPGEQWHFQPREAPLRVPEIEDREWDKLHFIRSVERRGGLDELGRAIAQMLPDRFTAAEVAEATHNVRTLQQHQIDARDQLAWFRTVAQSSYRATFPEDTTLSQRVLMPTAEEERLGIEDVRMILCDDGVYRGTYTAYDGLHIASRLVTTADFRCFEIERLTGPPARTKGMAIFGRAINGAYLALTRGDGESMSLSRSYDGLEWGEEEPLYVPDDGWEVVQSGNCGPPIETEYGWIALTHGVGPMRVYSIGAILLDREDPSRVIGVFPGPLIRPDAADGHGYVPNVVYSCGGLLHDERIWIPFGVGDQRVRVAVIGVRELVEAMQPPTRSAAEAVAALREATRIPTATGPTHWAVPATTEIPIVAQAGS